MDERQKKLDDREKDLLILIGKADNQDEFRRTFIDMADKTGLLKHISLDIKN